MEGLVVTCRSCGTKNRKNPLKPEAPVCARCGNVLPFGGGPFSLDEMAFLPVLRAARVPVLVDFWAAWCGPCRAFAPVLEQFAKRHEEDVLVIKVDSDANPRLSQQFQIASIPTTVLFRGPVEVARQSGALPLAALDAWVMGRVGQGTERQA